jgi:hypothetical protein
MRTRPLALLLALPLLAACSPPVKVTTARAFIANYSDAMLHKSARRVLAMEADGPLMQRFARNAAQREQLGRFDPERRRGELERLFQQEDLWWQAWTQTRYAGERVHGDHLDVEVQVAGAFSQVILVRADDGTLRLHPLPGWVHAEPPASDERGTAEEGGTEEEPVPDGEPSGGEDGA